MGAKLPMDRFDVEYREPSSVIGRIPYFSRAEWSYYDNGGDTLSTAERRAKYAASRHEGQGRVLRNGVEVARFQYNPYSKTGDRRLHAKRVKA